MQVFNVNGIKVHYESELDGGGTSFGMLFVPIVKRYIGHANKCLEAFSGPGFIGFSLLAYGLCDELVLADINPRAVDFVRLTVRENGLEGRVRYYVSDVLDGIPSGEIFDLVVANPPHFNETTVNAFCTQCNCCDKDVELLKALDRGWTLHRRFYESVGRYLSNGGNVMLIENSEGSRPEEFIQMIKDGDLSHVDTIWPSIDDIAYALLIMLKSVRLRLGLRYMYMAKHIIRDPTLMKYALIIGSRVSRSARGVLDWKKFYIIWSRKS